jgi:hypothetical protein
VWYSTNPHANHRDALSMGTLQMALGAAQRQAPSQEWDNPGPASAALRAARSVGWTFISAIKLLDEEGETMDLQGGAPEMLKIKFRKRWPQIQVREALAHRLQHHKADEHSQQLLDKGWELGPLTKALQSKGKHALRPREKKQLLLFFAATGDKMIKGTCIKCNRPDSINHRLADCESEEAEDHRAILLDPETNKFSGAFNKFCKFLSEQTNMLAKHRTWMPPSPYIVGQRENGSPLVAGNGGMEVQARGTNLHRWFMPLPHTRNSGGGRLCHGANGRRWRCA